MNQGGSTDPQLSETKVTAITSSHLRLVDKKLGGSTKLLEELLPQVNEIYAFPGLTTILGHHFLHSESLRPHPQTWNCEYCIKKARQFHVFKGLFKKAKNSELLLVSASNDWKYFVCHKGQLLEPTQDGLEVWAAMKSRKRTKYNLKKKPLLNKESETILKQKIDDYVSILRNLLSSSSFETVYQSSLLERLDTSFPTLPMYFCVINACLHDALWHSNRNDTMVNRKGKPIKLVFVNVSQPFHEAEPPKSIFKLHEQKAGHMVHRNEDSMREVCHIYTKEMIKTSQLKK
jgi:hypothetical protein